MKFQLTKHGTTAICIGSGEEHSIEFSPIYLEWVANGGVPLPVSPAEIELDIRADRDARIQAVSWRYERYAREARLGMAPTDDINALDKYVQTLAEVPNQTGFPDDVQWPTL